VRTKSIYLGKSVLLFTVLFLCLQVIDVKAQEEKSSRADRDSVISAAKEIISHVVFCGLVTLDEKGKANVRVMNPFPPEEDMSVWMATSSDTRKYKEILNNPNVTLFYSNLKTAEGYVSISGKAELIDDKAEKQKRKRAYWDQSFPDWNKLILIKIVPEKMEVVNYKHKIYGDAATWHAETIYFK